MPNPVVHFEVTGKDAAKTQAFYSELFEWKLDANNPMNYGIVEAQEGRGIGGGVSGGAGTPECAERTSVTFYVAVQNIDDCLGRVKDLGGEVLLPRSDVPGGPTIAQFADPDGNVIGLLEAE